MLCLPLDDPWLWAWIGVWTLVIIWPLNRALLRGLEAARDPMNRMVPGRNPWWFLRPVFFRNLRWWWAIWSLCILLLSIRLWQSAVLRSPFWRQYTNELIKIQPAFLHLTILDRFALFVSVTVLVVTACVSRAPRCRKNWALGISAILEAAIVYLFIHAILCYCFPASWTNIRYVDFYEVEFRGTGGVSSWTTRNFPATEIYSGALSILFAIESYIAIRIQKSRWFRLEEEQKC